MSIYKQKNLGLDLVRSIAIIFVLICHAGPTNQIMFNFGFFGVEIFFVLSGFLIGQIIIKDYLQSINFKTLANFWIRRWFRTLPLYFLVLVLMIVFFNPNNKIYWQHFVFLQNFSHETLTWFSVSWSLVIEEWFYLIVPLIFFIIPVKRINKKAQTGVILAFIFLVLFARSYYVFTHEFDFEDNIRKNVLLRLDSLMIGVLLANLKISFSGMFNLLKSKYVFFVSLLVFVLLLLRENVLVYNFIDEKTIASTIGLTINSALFALMIPFVENSLFVNETLNKNRIASTLIKKTSLYTYSIYLIHVPIYDLIITVDRNSAISFSRIWQTILALVVVYFVSYVLYTFYEKPMMNFRDKFSFKNSG